MTVTGLPVQEPERYLTRQEMAAHMGVHVNTIDKLVRAGAPSETWGLRSRRFLASRFMAWARAQQRKEAA